MRTIPELLRRAAEARAIEPLASAGDRSLGGYELRQAVGYLAAGFLEEGLKKGDRVALFLPNGLEFLQCWLALAEIGATAVPINTALKAAEVAFILDHAQAAALIAGAELPQELGGAEAPWTGRTIFAGERAAHSLFETGVPLEELQGVHAVDFFPEVEEDDVATFVYTSGSTGRPKAVMQTHRTYVLSGEGFAHWVGIRPGDRVLAVLPLFHINAQAYSTMGALAGGATLVIAERFSASGFWELARSSGATHFNCVGAMMQILCKREPSAGERDHAVRVAYCAPALPPEVHEAAERRFGLKIVIGYGLSECTYGTVTPLDGPGRPPSMGLPRQHPSGATVNRVRVVAADGSDAPIGEPGEIWLANDAVMKGYWRDPESTERALADGWLHTGDIAVRDAEGWLTFVDRRTDQIRRRGENIAAREVEEVLSAHPAVLEAAVIGVPSELGEDDVKAFAVLKEGQSVGPEELVRWCASRLAAFKVPRYLELRTELPRTPTHRVAKPVLKKEPLCPPGCWDGEGEDRRWKVEGGRSSQ
ncbi:MAG: AMP-binding protein [Candidatus Wallbacteria bacterium]|nr:AMP-binding protein [Candidatus Wallbacteria bacterium]